MKTNLKSLRPLALALCLPTAAALSAPSAHAAFLFTLTQTGGNVVVTGSGTLNTTALTLGGSGSTTPGVGSAFALVIGGAPVTDSYTYYTGLTGPASFGSGTNAGPASAGSGDTVGIAGAALRLYVPPGYISGAALSDTDTYTGQTFASIGFTPGTYTYTWGSGATADSLTVMSVVPEPGTKALALLALGSAGVLAWRKRRNAAAN